MNAVLLLEHYARIADAPDAIARLRRFVLDLAVRGKLVEQDTAEEPASVLLERIAAEKARLTKLKAIKKSDVPEVSPEDAPYSLPFSWEWAMLGQIGDWGAGSTPSRGNSDLYGGGVTWLKSGELNDNRALAGSEETVTEAAVKSGSFRVNKPGDVLIAMYGATIGKVAILAEPAVTNQAVCGCTPSPGISNQYLFLFLLSQREQFHSASEGGAQPNISKVKIVNTAVPVPPTAEQHRIVAKVDELMALCDELKAVRAAREAARDTFALSTLARLNSPDPETFTADARFTLANLAPLTTRPDQIKQLRQTILNLAMRGKLVAQDASDENAIAVLRRLKAAKDALVECGKLKKVRPAPEISSNETLFPLPQGWCRARLQDVMDVRDGTHDSPKDYKESGGIPLVTSKDFKNGEIDFASARRISPVDHAAITVRSHVERDDILFSMIGGNIGNQVIVLNHDPFSIKNVALFKHYSKSDFIPKFAKIYTEHLAQSLQSNASGGAQPFVSLGSLRNLIVAVPPVEEQHRIVAKVGELMALSNQLEASIATGEQTRLRLLEAVLHNALEPA